MRLNRIAFLILLSIPLFSIAQQAIISPDSLDRYFSNLNKDARLTKANIEILAKNNTASNSQVFKFLMLNESHIDELMQKKDYLTHHLNYIIQKEEIAPFRKDKNTPPDWNKITASVKKKYGSLGVEKVYGAQMAYYLDNQDWVNFGKYYALYYKTAYTHSDYHINNISWSVFEHVTQRSVLEIAITASKYSMDNFGKDSPTDIDTYANILYKFGNKQKAITWERKAMELSKNEKVFVETVDKMEKGIPTWPINN